ncbi:hypothetical protein [Actinoplanes subglobosus]|uniref:Uncharacterized protein n=1 Tax=Actinoplanes subglobosus TaxID=1547892 RepID=A0ABV8IK34_9ACTN
MAEAVVDQPRQGSHANGTLYVLVDEAQLAAGCTGWQPLAPAYARGVLAKYMKSPATSSGSPCGAAAMVAAASAHPSRWAISAGNFRAVCTGASELAGHLAGPIDRWVTDHPDESADNLTVMRTAATDLKETSRTLVFVARQFGGIRAGRDGTGD